MEPTSRGQLTPDPRIPIARIAPPEWAAHAIKHFWVVEWSLPSGVSARQLALGYPVLNLVAEPARLAVYGPTTTAGARVLEGTGWAVGALLRPAATPLFTGRPARFANLAADFLGPTPAALMRRRRIQLAAEKLRTDPEMPLADLAQDLGYADQPHLTRDVRAVLGLTPREYARGQAAQSPRGPLVS